MGGDGLGSFSSRFIQRLGTVTVSPNSEGCFVPSLDLCPYPANRTFLMPGQRPQPMWQPSWGSD